MESHDYVRTDELNFLFGDNNDEQHVTVTTTQKPEEQNIQVEPLVDQNFTYQVHVFFLHSRPGDWDYSL